MIKFALDSSSIFPARGSDAGAGGAECEIIDPESFCKIL